jgi:hypothetical protein
VFLLVFADAVREVEHSHGGDAVASFGRAPGKRQAKCVRALVMGARVSTNHSAEIMSTKRLSHNVSILHKSIFQKVQCVFKNKH